MVLSPVLKVVPSGTGTSCSYHVPITVRSTGVFGTVQHCRHIEKRRKAENIVPPENHLQLAEIGLLQICAFVDRAIIHAADFHAAAYPIAASPAGSRRGCEIRAPAGRRHRARS